MISRIMLSLKKAADSQQKGWALSEPTVNATDFQSLMFLRPANGANGIRNDDVPLDTIHES